MTVSPATEKDPGQNTSWWLTSIAVAVVCCAVLFILFASYLVELKDEVKDNGIRINAIENREQSLLTSVETLSKRVNSLQQAAGNAAPPTSSPIVTDGASGENMPVAQPMGLPAADPASVPAAPSVLESPPTTPGVMVPVTPAPDKP